MTQHLFSKVSRQKISAGECDPALICHQYVYVLRHAGTGELYYGYTANLCRRLEEHQQREPWHLVYYEAYASAMDARHREQKLKHYGQTRAHLRHRIENSLSEQISAGFNSARSVTSPLRAP